MNGVTNSWTPRVITETISNTVDEADSTSKLNERRSSHHSLTPSPEQSFGKKMPQYNSFRVMKQKVKFRTTVFRTIQKKNCYNFTNKLRIIIFMRKNKISDEERFEIEKISFGGEY